MNLDISQLNNLQKFTRFAFSAVENDPNVDKVKVAQLTGDAVIRNDSDKPGFFGSLFRSRANRQLNNQTRDLFKQTIAKLFGGEESIPQEVKDAMHFSRFDGKGRPLTAKRINETKSAIINFLSRKEASAGLSPLQMGMVLNSSTTVDQYLKSDRSEIVTGATASINDVGGDDDNNVINTNTVKNDNTNITVDKPQVDYKAELDQLKAKATKLGGTEKLSIKERTRLVQLEGIVNGRGIMENFGVTGRVLSKNSTKIERDVNDTGDIAKVLNKQNVAQTNKKKPKKANFQVDD
jgi:hypothetical protein